MWQKCASAFKTHKSGEHQDCHYINLAQSATECKSLRAVTSQLRLDDPWKISRYRQIYAPFRISLLYLTLVVALKLQVPEATTYLEDLHNYSLNPSLLFPGLYVLLSTNLLPPSEAELSICLKCYGGHQETSNKRNVHKLKWSKVVKTRNSSSSVWDDDKVIHKNSCSSSVQVAINQKVVGSMPGCQTSLGKIRTPCFCWSHWSVNVRLTALWVLRHSLHFIYICTFSICSRSCKVRQKSLTVGKE